MLKNLWCKNLKHYFVLMHWSVVLARVSHCVMENKSHVCCLWMWCIQFNLQSKYYTLKFCVVGLILSILSQQMYVVVFNCIQFCFQSCSHESKYCTLQLCNVLPRTSFLLSFPSCLLPSFLPLSASFIPFIPFCPRYTHRPTMSGPGLYDPTEVMNRAQLNLYTKEGFIKVGFYVLSFLVYLYKWVC